VEVRDRNDQPVAGAIVRFAVTKGRATFSGARTLTLTTNAAGRAAVTGFSPAGTGALQLSASATFQGETAVAAITQTNVMTAAEAAAAGSAGAGSGTGSGTAAGGAGGGAGGGMSATTVAIVGGAAAGGAVVAKETILPGHDGARYMGVASGQFVETITSTSSQATCQNTWSLRRTMTLGHMKEDGGNYTGKSEFDGTEGIVASTCGNGPFGENPAGWESDMNVSGPASRITFTKVQTMMDGTETVTFVGSLTGDIISGIVTVTRARVPTPALSATGSGSGTFQITLQKQ
jgi:hypothetical protein